MPWDTSRPSDSAKYRSKEHRQRRADLVRRINDGEPLECQADVCLFDREPITNTNGMDDDGLNLGHEDDGIHYRGPEHRACNLHDGAVRGRARQGETNLQW